MNRTQINTFGTLRRAVRVIVAIGACMFTLAMGSAVHADVLYDTTHYTDQELIDYQNPSFIGGAANFGSLLDVQTADDFSLSEARSITSVTSDFELAFTDTLPADGISVEFFSDVGGTPAENASYSVTTQNYTATAIPSQSLSYRFTVDLTGANIELGPGTWWLSVSPVDTTNSSIVYLAFGYRFGDFGLNAHSRNAGQDHGNGYAGFPVWTDDWQPAVGSGGTPRPNDLVMRIEGTAVPAPGAMALLGLAGLIGRRRHRRCV